MPLDAIWQSFYLIADFGRHLHLGTWSSWKETVPGSSDDYNLRQCVIRERTLSLKIKSCSSLSGNHMSNGHFALV